MSEASSSSEQGSQDGNYVVVARRYRPRGFGELVGQEHVGRALTNAIETNRVGHAYLFTGARGVGKTSTARIFAKALNDPGGPTAEPDNSSEVALAIDAGEDVDVIEIDGASNRGIDEIRSLRANVGVRPSRSRFKIYIIDEVHMLTGAAFNALLKTLEEPPEHVKFIFCTTDPEKIPITVLSRCQRFDFAPVEVAKIVTRLREIVDAESAEASDEALELIARRAAGSMRDSQSLLEQVLSFSDGKLTPEQVHAMLGTADEERLHAMALAMAERHAASAMQQLDAAIDAGVDAGRLAEQLLGYFRDLMAVAVGCDQSMLRHTSASLHDQLGQLAQQWGLQTVLAVVGLIDQTLVRIRHSVHPRVLLEATLIQICQLPDLQSIVDLAAAAGSAPAHSIKAGEKKNATLTVPTERASVDHPVMAESPAPSPVADSTTAAAASTDPAPQDVSESAEPAPADADQSHESSEPAGPARELPRVWTQQTAEEVWSAALEQLESMTETLARAVEKVTLVGDSHLRLVFPAGSELTMSRFDMPEHKSKLSASLAKVAGRAVALDLVAAPPKVQPKAAATTVNRPSRIQRMREIEANPFVKCCVEMFEAEIVRVDKPR